MQNQTIQRLPIWLWSGLIVLATSVGGYAGSDGVVTTTTTESLSSDTDGERVLLAQRSSRSSRSSRGSQQQSQQYGNQQYGNQQYGNQQYGNQQSGNDRNSRRSSRNSGRSSRNSRYSDRNAPPNPQQQQVDKDQADKAKKAIDSAKNKSTARGRPAGGGSKAGEEVGVSGATAKNARGRAPAKGKKAPKAPAKPPPPTNATLYALANPSTVLLNEVLEVSFEFVNPQKKGYDRLEFTIDYDPTAFEFIGLATGGLPNQLMDDSVAKNATIRSVLESKKDGLQYENVVDPVEGRIHYLLDLQDETSTASGRIGVAAFRAMKEVRSSPFRFLTQPSDSDDEMSLRKSGVTSQGVDILGDPGSVTDGFVSSDVGVYAVRERTVADRSFNRVEDDEAGFYNTSLRLVTPRREIVVGEDFEAHVVLDNPDADAFDQISLLIAYNPNVLAAVDSDSNNAIAKGVNIHDGSYRKDFPFDYAVGNTVDTEKGLIDYRMRAYRRPLRAEGTLASIRFKALKTTKKTSLRLLVDLESQEPTTGLFYRLKDVLAADTDPADGLTTISLQIGRVPTTLGAAAPSPVVGDSAVAEEPTEAENEAG